MPEAGATAILAGATNVDVVDHSSTGKTGGLTIVNSPGTVDAGYRGEIRITLLNTDASEPFAIEVNGDGTVASIAVFARTKSYRFFRTSQAAM